MPSRAADSLEAARKKRKQDKPPASTATSADVQTYVESATIPSMHTTKPPGVSALALAKEGTMVLTGG